MLVLKSKLGRLMAIFLTLILVGFNLQTQPETALASHFRGSLVTVEYHAPTGSQAAEVHVSSTTLTQSSLDGMMSVNVYLVSGGVPTMLNNCQGNSTRQTTTDTSNPLFKIQNDAFTITGCFNTAGVYVFEAQNCCRISGIQNTPNNSIQFAASINIDSINDSASPTYS